MNTEDFGKMIQLYKMKLSKEEEQSIMYQVLLANIAKDKEAMGEEIIALKEKIQVLEEQLNNSNAPTITVE